MKRLEAAQVVAQLNALFSRLGENPEENIREMVAATGKMLGGVCALYNKLDARKRSLCTWTGYNTPETLPGCDAPDGHICFEATIKGGNRPVVLPEILGTPYAESDPYVARFGLRAYLGYPVQRGLERLGSLCVVDVEPRSWTEEEIDLIASLAKAISLEEERLVGRRQALMDRAFLDQTQKLSGVGGWDYDPESDRLNWTDQTFRIHGLPPGYPPSVDEAERFISAEYRDQYRQAFRRTLTDGIPFDLELCINTHKGETRWIRSTAEPVIEDGRVRHILGSVQDMTQRRAMAQSRQAGEKARQTCAALMIQAARETAAPLRAMVATLERIAPEGLAPADRHRLESAMQTGQGLVVGMEDMAALSGKLSGDSLDSVTGFSIHALLEGIVDSLTAAAAEKRIDLRFVVDSRIPQGIRGDRLRLRRILFILMANAVRFTDRGGVAVDVAPISRGNGSVRILFSVSDTGAGMPDTTVDKVFAPTPARAGKPFDGKGLGLALVRSLIRDLGGNLSVDSEVGRGTTIHASLPFSLDEGQHSSRSVRPDRPLS